MSESFDYNPLSRREAFLAAIAGDPDTVPVPMSRREELLAAIADRLSALASASSGSGVLIVNDVDGTLDKTWQEIADADLAVLKTVGANLDNGWDEGSTTFDVVKSAVVQTDGYGYSVTLGFDEYYTDSASDYPAKVDNGGGME